MNMHFFFYGKKIKRFAVAIIWKYFSKGRAKNDEMSWNNRTDTRGRVALFEASLFPGLLHRDGEVSCWESHQKTVSI